MNSLFSSGAEPPTHLVDLSSGGTPHPRSRALRANRLNFTFRPVWSVVSSIFQQSLLSPGEFLSEATVEKKPEERARFSRRISNTSWKFSNAHRKLRFENFEFRKRFERRFSALERGNGVNMICYQRTKDKEPFRISRRYEEIYCLTFIYPRFILCFNLFATNFYKTGSQAARVCSSFQEIIALEINPCFSNQDFL